MASQNVLCELNHDYSYLLKIFILLKLNILQYINACENSLTKITDWVSTFRQKKQLRNLAELEQE